ncbi:MAG: TIGR04282 family arsenosugar biosynthesis glycosyltransferase [Gammaproteobacteria bacterium]|nr:TIGR04282 family arsenosugar biosynthesis glycosyltransferase [Gammaproteobacteria bacterium]MCI0591062.1 TIGR04282 family arsenosugar biosynthesis glycosyltransferase [Gammaproteobacteria bacterium]
MNKSLLIIFVKNPQLGKVKKRLAATIGDEKALEVYNYLLRRTHAVCSTLYADKIVFYSSFVDDNDIWQNDQYQKFVQTGTDLGQRMHNAFEHGFSLGYNSIVIIGSDCADLNERVLLDAFQRLDDHDTVIGPTSDGGYYLLGMTKLHKELFTNKRWSTDSLYNDTLQDINRLKLSTYCLPRFSDVDTEDDLGDLRYLLY